MDDPSGKWASVRDLSEWAFCPRAHWYARRGPEPAELAGDRARREAGEIFHEQELARLAAPAPARGGVAAGLVAVGLAFFLAALFLAGWL